MGFGPTSLSKPINYFMRQHPWHRRNSRVAYVYKNNDAKTQMGLAWIAKSWGDFEINQVNCDKFSIDPKKTKVLQIPFLERLCNSGSRQ